MNKTAHSPELMLDLWQTNQRFSQVSTFDHQMHGFKALPHCWKLEINLSVGGCETNIYRRRGEIGGGHIQIAASFKFQPIE